MAQSDQKNCNSTLEVFSEVIFAKVEMVFRPHWINFHHSASIVKLATAKEQPEQSLLYGHGAQ
jgi:hypothetical protein